MAYSKEDRFNTSTGCGCTSAMMLLGVALVFEFASYRVLGGMILVFIASFFAMNMLMRYVDGWNKPQD